MNRSTRDQEFTEFVVTRQPHLRRIAYAICGDWHSAEDVLQTALAKLYASWPRIKQQGKEEAYARQIMVRAAIDESRRPWRRERAYGVVPDRPVPESTRVEDRTALMAALHDLPTQQRAVVVLRHWLGLSVAETARELGIGEGTVKSHTSRGLEALRAALEPAGRCNR